MEICPACHQSSGMTGIHHLVPDSKAFGMLSECFFCGLCWWVEVTACGWQGLWGSLARLCPHCTDVLCWPVRCGWQGRPVSEFCTTVEYRVQSVTILCISSCAYGRHDSLTPAAINLLTDAFSIECSVISISKGWIYFTSFFKGKPYVSQVSSITLLVFQAQCLHLVLWTTQWWLSLEAHRDGLGTCFFQSST